MPTPRQKLTKTVVEALPAPAEGYTIFRDAELKGFGVRVMASGVRAYFCERKQYGKTIRTTLGQHGEVSATEARKLAEQVLASIRAGENPNAKRKAKIVAAKAVPVTFGDLAEGYMRERMDLGKLKPRTIKDYRADLAGPLATLVGVPATQITRQVIADLQKDLSVNRGPTTANRAMRFARAVFNFAAENEDFTDPAGEPVVVTNPTAVLKTRRLWNQAKRKHGFLGEQDLGRWVDAVLSIDRYRWSEYRDRARARAENVEGYLLVMVCLGLRSGEASALRREDWDVKQQILTIADPKNINTAGKAFAVPVGWRIAWLLDRHAARADGWLFEGEAPGSRVASDKHGPRAVMADVKARSGADFTPHDLRRTYASLLNSLTPSPSQYQIKRLLNHTPDKDVTTEYIQHETEALRAIVQRVEDLVFGSMTAARPGH